MCNNMTTCHDPYRELELYLEKAQEEIVKAVKELEQHEEAEISNSSSSCENTSEILLPPPRAFLTLDYPKEKNYDYKRTNSVPQNTVTRVCHDGNLLDFKNSSPNCNTLNNHSLGRTSFFSSLRPGILGRNGNSTYSPNTRRRLWKMHPSISFPETSKDLLLLGNSAVSSSTECKPRSYSETSKDLDITSSLKGQCNGKLSNENIEYSVADELFEKRRFNRNSRRRSNSETLSPSSQDETDVPCMFPRPPSGDVNLLSIWANNLVLELDKSLSRELNSMDSLSPSSECSLSPSKPDDSFGTNNFKNANFPSSHFQNSHYGDSSRLSLPSKSLKPISMSPDSGIEPVSCETPEIFEDVVDSFTMIKENDDMNYDLIAINNDMDHITPPPPAFEDKKITESIPVCNITEKLLPEKSHKTVASEILNVANSVLETSDMTECLTNNFESTGSQAYAVATETIELEDSPLVRTTCVINDVPIDVSSKEHSSSSKQQEQLEETLKQSKTDHNIFYSLPKPPKVIPNAIEKWCSSLPRDTGKNSDVICPQRSTSLYAVSCSNHVSIADLTAFIQNVKNGSYQPPSCADVSTDVKDDNENKDAVTQTTPVPLSRSSSFTWVTECDCSDWDFANGNSGSEDSLLVADCSNCKSGSKNHNSSSSSLGISSDEDCEPLTPGSGGSSSLYLSACSGSSDSFDDANLAIEVPILYTDPVKPSEDIISQNSRRSLRNSESTLRGSALGDISEEQGTSETISVKSLTSNPSLTDSNAADNPEQSASFPSTLKVMKKNKSTASPAQPIEPTVLVINELNLKSVSAPVLLRQKRHACIPKAQESSSSDSSPPTGARSKDSFCDAAQVPTRAHSAKELNELQAIEACTWLRAAGFPQYAQMYEDNQFPIDISIVQKDHAFLHPDSIQSLFRRLNTLNRCAKMKFVDHVPRKSLRVDESDDEEQYALSENWEFQRSSRRWSRIPSPSDGITDYVPNDPPSEPTTKLSGHLLPAPGRKYLSPEEAYCSSHDSVFIDEQHSSPDSIRKSSLLKPERISMSPSGHIGDCSPGSSSGSGGTLSLASDDVPERRSLRRSGSDRVKEGAKALLRRMESLKGKRKKKIIDTNKMENVTTVHSGTDGSSSSSLTSSPQFLRSQKPADGTCLSSQQNAKKVGGVNLPKGTEDASAHSDSECHMFLISERWKDANSNDTKPVKQYITSQASVTITSTPDNLPLNPDTKEERHSNSLKFGALQKGNLLHPDYNTNQEYENFCDKRGSYYDNICAPLVVFNDLYAESLDRIPRQTNTCKSSQNQDDGDIIIINNERRDSGVGSSLTRGIATTHHAYPQQAQWHCFPHHYTSEIKPIPNPAHITDLTAPQMLLLRKLSLLKLTTVMEKFSPSSRTGWSWGVPKFIRRIRSPDYKDKVVFGVPLLLILQRTGQPLPVSIQAAIHYLRKTALDSTGLFRKSGVRSRIQKLKSMNETSPEKISYEEQQAYDVADMLKLYFRELPEALLTNKLSETFISIFQCIPEDLRLEAIQAALMLMPDENREVLQSLLEFLYEVCQHSGVNQMSATNLAVCFAPSLFHLSTARSASSSPRRRKTVGVPDLRELNENRAAYECLSCMVLNYKTLFTVSEETISQSRISSAVHFQPATLEELSCFSSNGQSGWKVYIDSCIQMFLKEVREKYKGWVSVSQNDHVELAYKKLSDGHPLRLWKVSTEVEAPPVELLNRILRERHLWDNTLVKWKVVMRFNKQTEIFQYLSSSLSPHPPCDYCVLRSWRTDLPKGTCVLIETSVNHPEAEIVPGSVRALVLASRYLIEPCGSGKSRITHLSRVDTRGRSPEWYNRAYGQICVLSLIRLRNSFSRSGADGPETKV